MTNPFILDSCSVQRFVPVLDENGKQSQEGYSFNYRIVYPKALRNANQQQLQKVLDIYRCIGGGVPLSKDQEESIPQAIEKEIEKETLEYKDYALGVYEDEKDLYVESSRETGEDSTIGILCFELSREVVVKESEGNFICFQSNYTEYKGGAHGMYGTSYLLFDSSSLEVINSEMLFCPGVEEEVNAIISALSGRELSGHDNFYLDENGITYDRYTDDTQLAICSMEYIYFARPDSNIHGVNVHTARKRMGAQLAREFKHEADIVVGVPNSSLSAAMGFAEESGLPNEMGLIKNQYTQRTFIQPTQELREQGVRMKLSAVSGVVKGKRVVMVDDSIVRGTTSRRIVQLLKEAGASEVHVAIGSPALAYPCFYGIDIQTRQELIAANHTVEETCQIIGADSLTYLSIDGLINSIGIETDAPNGGLCVAYFDGDYPTPLYDYEEEYRRSLGDKTSFYK